MATRQNPQEIERERKLALWRLEEINRYLKRCWGTVIQDMQRFTSLPTHLRDSAARGQIKYYRQIEGYLRGLIGQTEQSIAAAERALAAIQGGNDNAATSDSKSVREDGGRDAGRSRPGDRKRPHGKRRLRPTS